MIKPMYSTTVKVSGGRNGRAVSDDGVLDVNLRLPKTNGVNDGTNPEQLFAAAWGGCLQSALLSIAKQSDVEASASTVNVEISQGPDGEGVFGLAAKIVVTMPGVKPDTARQIANAAHEVCPYSRATQGNMPVEVAIA